MTALRRADAERAAVTLVGDGQASPEGRTLPVSEIGANAKSMTGRVLVVDDEESILRVCRRALEAQGFHVETARDGALAIARVGEGFDAIVTDIQMPGLDGIQLLRRIRERDLDVPVVLMTGAPSLDSAMRAVEHGALRYIPKPFDARELVTVMKTAVAMGKIAHAKREALEHLGADVTLVGDRAGLEATFERALGTLWMAFQPIVSVKERRVFGHEALMRSVEPALPHAGAMLDAAERLRRVHALGRVTRGRAASAAEGLEPGDGIALFVNLHPHDLSDDALLDPASPLTAIASRVVLEVTERAPLDGLPDVRSRIRALRDLGFRLAVDDLGAGYAGLTALAHLEPEIVKLDMALVRGIDADPKRRKIVAKLTELAHDLGILVVAEGVETVAERDVVVDLGCDLLQGYLLARPGKAFPAVTL